MEKEIEVQEEITEKVMEEETTKKVVEPKTTRKSESKVVKEVPKVYGKTVTVRFLKNSVYAGRVKEMVTVLAKKLEASGKLEIIK